MKTHLDVMRAIVSGDHEPPPVARFIGFQLVEVERDRAVFRMEAEERHTNPMGTLHGGVLCDVSDAAMGCAFASTLDAGQSYTTLELSINFLRPVFKGTLTATGHVVKRTRKTGLIECDVTDEQGRLVARAKSTCLVLEGEDAKGR
jgi:uncharacterized protein (TIGR00369 family)